MAVRQATASDLEDLAHIVIASSDDDPCYPYRFPLKDQYPLHYEEHCRQKCREYLNTNTVIVYEVANPPNSRRQKRVVAFSVWEQPKLRAPRSKRSQTWPRWGTFLTTPKEAGDCCKEAQQTCRRSQQQQQQAGGNQQFARTPSHHKPFAREDRSRAFRDASKRAKETLLDAQYTNGYMFLKILLCHPTYRRKGAGTALVKWGTAVAHIHGVETALFSSPMGVPLYHKLGFQEVGRFEVRVDGDHERLDIPAMVLPAPSPPRSRRGSRCAAEAAPNGLRKCVTNNVLVAQKV
ncbi:hypothetical protein GE09DRAFT_1081387 [Coniochaeta sp. 2T2.1]|nr:hypothetical protein GE09DRAFT_1081387 [Coniochaeta sp. 2T2.1]